MALIEKRKRALVGTEDVTEEDARNRLERREFVFGRGGRTAFSGFSHAKARLDQAAGIASWTLHDIRRSVVTQMAEIGIEPHVIEACVNHVSGHKGGVAGIYNRANYREQKHTALQRWADWLEALVEGRALAGNVVALHQGGG